MWAIAGPLPALAGLCRELAKLRGQEVVAVQHHLMLRHVDVAHLCASEVRLKVKMKHSFKKYFSLGRITNHTGDRATAKPAVLGRLYSHERTAPEGLRVVTRVCA